MMKFPALSKRLVFQRLASSFFFLVLLATCYLLLAVSPVSAQTNEYLTPNTNSDVPKNMHTWTQNITIEVISAMICQLTGTDPINPKQGCLGVDPKTKKIGYVTPNNQNEIGGAIGLTKNAIVALYTPPIHTSDYFNDLAQNFGIVKQSYAQASSFGQGFQSLWPLMGLWKSFRDIVYMFFIIVFIVIGLAIMFRIKIDPRTVMSIENQIPKIIIGLITVTFSFAIAGLLIDLMYLSIYLTGNIIVSSVDSKLNPNITYEMVQSTTPMEAANDIGGSGRMGGKRGLASIGEKPSQVMGTFIGSTLDNTAGRIISGIILGTITKIYINPAAKAFDTTINKISNLATGVSIATAPFTGGTSLVARAGAGLLISFIVGAVTAATIPMLVGSVGSFIAYLIITIAILWALFRLAFELIKAYIFILLDIVFAPFWILAGLFPGSPVGFGAWIRDILSNLSVFPVTIAMFLLGKTFINAFGKAGSSNQAFVPPMVGNPSDINGIGAFIGLGIILLTPQVVNMMKDLFKAPQFKYMSAIGQAVGIGTGAVDLPSHAQKIAMLGYYKSYMTHVPVLGKLLGRGDTH